MSSLRWVAAASFSWIFLTSGYSAASAAEPLRLKKGSRVVLLGNGLGSRMMSFGHFETEIHRRHGDKRLFIRNMCDEGNTPGFRPHSGRPSPWAFPGAESFYPSRSEAKDRWGSGHTGVGDYDSPDAWLSRLEPDVVVAFFGFNESFRGVEGLDSFKDELRSFIRYTTGRRYNGSESPKLALVSPIAFEDLSESHGTPDGVLENANLALYTAAMEEVGIETDTFFVNLFATSQAWYTENREPLTRDGALLTNAGYQLLAPVLAQSLFGEGGEDAESVPVGSILAAVLEKNWMWDKHYKIPNGVHVYGRRNRPFGPDNYPHELKKLEEMTAIRDQAIWAVLEERTFDVAAADAMTHTLPVIETNFRPSGRKTGSIEYRYGDDAVASMKVAPGYKIDLFASELEFSNLANPVQMSFDNRGRLWIATMPTYPHYQPGDAKPNDKLIILEDTNRDGKADKETVFAEGLHLPTGFEFAPEGVYVAQGTHLMLLRDLDGDDRADLNEIVLSGFDDHDTHHVISAFCADPSGAIYMGEGTFLHSNVETAYGAIRSSNGGFWRYSPQRGHLERTARLSIPNPWGTAFDEFGQPFFLDTSDPNLRWMSPGTVNVRYGEFSPNPPSLIEEAQRVRPTSGLEFVSSRHFPDEVQGDVLLHNTIGFLGTKQHSIVDDGTGYSSRFRQDLLTCSDGNFRPVDLEFAPDGSLYLLDWHNVLVGHMQHSARDPLRDHVHGRVFRITYPARPLVDPARVDGASISVLLENLKLPEYRTRYRTRRELRGRASEDVLSALRTWVAALDATDQRGEHHMLEALWVTWGMNAVDSSLLRRLLRAKDFRVRSAAVRVLRYSGHQLPDQKELLKAAVIDDHGRVRLEAIAAASWLEPNLALPLIERAESKDIDDWIRPVYETSLANLKGAAIVAVPEPKLAVPTGNLEGRAHELFVKGAEVYRREGHCITCHQENGLGLPAAQFPPLAETQWVNGDPERLIKLTLHGLFGPIKVKDKTYPGLVPMTPFKGLSDDEIAAVLTYVRNTFGNRADAIFPSAVSAVRKATADQRGFLHPADLQE